ncbi:hypothetical protein CR513_29253, partial [Mucuna pruriens]
MLVRFNFYLVYFDFGGLTIHYNIHPIFHVSKLKPYHCSPPSTIHPSAPHITATMMDTCVLQTTTGTDKQLLIQCEGLPESYSTWEHEEDFLKSFPNYNLEDDMVLLDGRTSDTHPNNKHTLLNH